MTAPDSAAPEIVLGGRSLHAAPFQATLQRVPAPSSPNRELPMGAHLTPPAENSRCAEDDDGPNERAAGLSAPSALATPRV